jgi:RES domain-containing protein
MIVYRIAHAKYKHATLSGVGAEKVGGRWNEVGTRAVYCSENIALALLEYYVHSANTANLPKEMLLAKILIPDEFIIEELTDLPKKWNQYPHNANTAAVFTELAKNRNFFALRVPSSIIGLEYNIILNPLYVDFGKVEVLEFIKIPIDERFKRQN